MTTITTPSLEMVDVQKPGGSSTSLKPELTDLRIIAVSGSELFISWSPPTNVNPSDVTEYRVDIVVTGTQSLVKSKVVDGSTTQVLMGDLIPGTRYTVEVTATTDSCGPPKSNEVVTPLKVLSRRRRQVSGEEVTNLQVRALSPTSIKATWQAPINPHNKVTGYLVKLYQGETVAEMKTLKSSVTDKTFDYLFGGHEYTVSIAPIFDTTPGTLVSGVVTTPDKVPSIITTAKANAVSSSAIDVTWQDPVLGDVIDKYVIMVKQGDLIVGEFNVEGWHRKETIGFLQPGTRYEVTVFGRNKAGDGKPSVFQVTTLTGPPSDVTHLVAVGTCPDALNITWSPPTVSEAPINQYHVTVKEKASGLVILDKLLPWDITSLHLTNTKPDTTYIIHVSARTSEEGPTSSIKVVSCGPDAAEQDIVEALNIKDRDSRPSIQTIQLSPSTNVREPKMKMMFALMALLVVTNVFLVAAIVICISRTCRVKTSKKDVIVF